MTDKELNKEEHDGLWLLAIGVFLLFGVPFWNGLAEWYKVWIEGVFVFGGIIYIIIGRKKRSKEKL